MCDCHPRSAEDEKIWQTAKRETRTREEWMFLHDAIERYKQLILDNYKAPAAVPEEQG
jgi:hypothetical protein